MNQREYAARRIYSALEIPMNGDESVNHENLRRLVEYELYEGVEGFYCSGSSGEGLLLTLKERKEVLETVVDQVNGRVPVIPQIGTIRTRDVIELAEHAAGLGLQMASMIPPYYYKFSMEEITGYYRDVLEAVPELGIIVYNIPQFTGIEFDKENAFELLSMPGIVGVKHTSHNLYSLERMKAAFPDLILFNGFDEQFAGSLAMGADAAIGTTVNVFAPLFRKVRSLMEAGDMAGALGCQKEINRRVEIMCRYGIFNAVKYILTKRGIDCGTCRKPFGKLGEEAKRALDSIAESVME